MPTTNHDRQFNPFSSSGVNSNQTFFHKAMEMHTIGIQESLKYLPDETYRRFYGWILKQNGIRDRWLQLISIEKTVYLTEKLLEGVLTPEEMDFVLPYSVIMNTYLMYEVVSDNLAIGLAKHQQDDATFHQRRELLNVFNTAIIQQIRELQVTRPQTILEPLRSQIRTISSFDQSLNPIQHEKIAAAFLKDHQGLIHPEDLEYGLYSTLVANIEACRAFIDVLRDFEAFALIQDGLARRYEGVNRLIEGGPLPIDTLTEIGSDTMLVIPTVGYYVAIVGEILRPTPAYKTILDDGSLALALGEASLLVRLLNDVGPGVLTQSPDERQQMFKFIRAQQHEATSFEALLLEVAESYGPALTRLKKDLKHGEFNIGLYNALRVDNVLEAITIFEEQLDYLTRLYEQKQLSLNQIAKHISKQWKGTALAEIIVRFVRFHEVTYAQSFEDGGGEYAI